MNPNKNPKIDRDEANKSDIEAKDSRFFKTPRVHKNDGFKRFIKDELKHIQDYEVLFRKKGR